MAQDKQLSRIEAKLDALLEDAGIKPDEVTPTATLNRGQERKLTPQEQQAIDNAPKAEATVPPGQAPRVTAQNAPDTSSSVPAVPQDAVGNVTVETKEPDGDTTVETKPADTARTARNKR